MPHFSIFTEDYTCKLQLVLIKRSHCFSHSTHMQHHSAFHSFKKIIGCQASSFNIHNQLCSVMKRAIFSTEEFDFDNEKYILLLRECCLLLSLSVIPLKTITFKYERSLKGLFEKIGTFKT